MITSNDFPTFKTAIESAPSGSTIEFDLGASSTIVFTEPVQVDTNLRFLGDGSVVFDGGGNTGLFRVTDTMEFDGFTFQGANSSFGGAIENSGPNLLVRNSHFIDNHASHGGSIFAGPTGTVTIEHSTFANGSASFGGAISSAGVLNVYGTNFTDNTASHGGSISAFSTARIENSHFRDGSASNGAFIRGDNFTVSESTFFNAIEGYALRGETMVVERSLISEGTSSGALFVSQSAEVSDSTITGFASGTAVRLFGAYDTELLLENSTISSNASGIRGGPSTSLQIRHTTLTDHQRAIDSNGNADIENSIVAGNSTDIASGLTLSAMHSLVGDVGATGLVDGQDGNIVGDGVLVRGYPIEHLFGDLADNGGPTPTMQLMSLQGQVNPAIDAGGATTLMFDQRGAPYLRTVGVAPDLGAVESVPEPNGLALFFGLAALMLRRNKNSMLPQTV